MEGKGRTKKTSLRQRVTCPQRGRRRQRRTERTRPSTASWVLGRGGSTVRRHLSLRPRPSQACRQATRSHCSLGHRGLEQPGPAQRTSGRRWRQLRRLASVPQPPWRRPLSFFRRPPLRPSTKSPCRKGPSSAGQPVARLPRSAACSGGEGARPATPRPAGARPRMRGPAPQRASPGGPHRKLRRALRVTCRQRYQKSQDPSFTTLTPWRSVTRKETRLQQGSNYWKRGTRRRVARFRSSRCLGRSRP